MEERYSFKTQHFLLEKHAETGGTQVSKDMAIPAKRDGQGVPGLIPYWIPTPGGKDLREIKAGKSQSHRQTEAR